MVVTDQVVYQNRFSSTEIHTFSKGPICSIFTRPLTDSSEPLEQGLRFYLFP